jgi:hypothetical protein
MGWGIPLNEDERRAFEEKLGALRIEHRDLDSAIHALGADPVHDQLALRRMKKRKLLLKDQIAWIERQLDPDIPA